MIRLRLQRLKEAYTRKLWATILVAAILGILFFVVIRVTELLVLRGRAGAAS